MPGSRRRAGADHSHGAGRPGRFWLRQFALCLPPLCLLAFLVLLSSVSASADEPSGQTQGLPTSEDFASAIESGVPASIAPVLTNLEAAEGIPHRDLARDEAVELLQGVFEPELQGPAGIFDELEVDKFLAPNVAVISGDEGATREAKDPEPDSAAVMPEGEPEPSETSPVDSEPWREKGESDRQASAPEEEHEDKARSAGEGPGQLNDALLLESSVPLRAEASSGQQEAVDLSLEHTEGELQPVNPIVEVGVPRELGEGINLPGSGVRIDLTGAPEGRTPSVVDASVAAYPNVARDTDLAVAPTPTGVETLTQFRSADSPRSQTFELQLPAGATLEATEEGGAAVVDGQETLVGVSPPTAVDASGAEVPVSLGVVGNSLTLTVSPEESTRFPLLVDPLYQAYEWATSKYWQDGICNNSFEAQISNPCNTHEEWSSETYTHTWPPTISGENQFWGWSSQVPQGTPGLFIRSSGTVTNGDRGTWNYTVPRFFTDQNNYGVRPTSFIVHATLSKLLWQAFSSHLSPYLFAGIWDTAQQNWVSYYTHEGMTEHGLNDMSWQYQFPNSNGDTNAKVAAVGVNATETQPDSNADVYVGYASIELGDKDSPGIGESRDRQAGSTKRRCPFRSVPAILAWVSPRLPRAPKGRLSSLGKRHTVVRGLVTRHALALGNRPTPPTRR